MIKILRRIDREILLNLLLGLTAKVLGALSLIIVAPIVISGVGLDQYGVYVSLISIFGVFSFLDFGISLAVQNKLSFALESGDTTRVGHLIRFLFNRTLAIGFFILIAVFLTAFLGFAEIISGSRDLISADLLRVSYLFLGLSALMFWLVTPARVIFSTHGYTYFSHIPNILAGVLFIGGVYFMRSFFSDIGKLALMQLASAVGAALCFFLLLLKNRFFIFIRSGEELTGQERKSITSSGFGFLALQGFGFFLYQLDTVIVSNWVSLSEGGRYYLIMRWASIPLLGWSLILQPVWVRLSKANALGNIFLVKKIMKRTILGGLFLGLLSMVLVPTVGYSFINSWASADVHFLRIELLAAAGYLVLRLWVDTWAVISNAFDNIKGQIFTAIVQVLIFIIVIFMFKNGLSLITVILAHVVALLVCPAVLLPIFNKRHVLESRFLGSEKMREDF